jgi:signal transduction histidine kinase
MSWRYRAATVMSVLAGGFVLTALAFTVMAPGTAALVSLSLGLLIVPPAVGLGMVIARRRPNLIGELLVAIGLSVAFVVARETAWQVLAERPDTAARVDWLVAVTDQAAVWIFVTVGLLLLHFPDGLPPSRRWRRVPAALVVAAAINQPLVAFSPEPFRAPLAGLTRPFAPLPTWLQVIELASLVSLLTLTLACAVSLVIRFRRSDPLRRIQIKWLSLAGLGIPLFPLMCLVEIGLWGRPLWLSAAVGVVALIAIPVTTGVAVLRHDLYDVDKALATTITWAVVTLALLGVYVGTSFAVGVIVGGESAAAAAGVTALCAVALAPLRHRLQAAVDRRVYPLRRAAIDAIDALHRDTSADRARPEQLEAVLRATLRDPELRVGYQIVGTDGFVDAAGERVDPIHGTSIVAGNDAMGVLVPGPTALASHELMREVATRSATLVELVRLRLELTAVLREVESSRTRLVQIGYEERRRLERDLHDGAQQRLVSLGMSLLLARRHLSDGSVDVEGTLDQAVVELGTAVAELRQIAHGLRPSLLDDGLGVAIVELVRTVPVPVHIDIQVDDVPDDVATTAYYVASEALANAVKHSDASLIELAVARVDGSLIVRVVDDGRGGAELSPRAALADRIAAMGGTLRIDSPVGRGTVVEGVLPCG